MEGDSLRRQTEASEAYAAEYGMYIDYSRHLQDLGISAYHGKNAALGKLARFFTAIQTGYVPAGSTLLVENLDRLGREQILPSRPSFQRSCTPLSWRGITGAAALSGPFEEWLAR